MSCIHPTNTVKAQGLEPFARVIARVEDGLFPPSQLGRNQTPLNSWTDFVGPAREEPFVFVLVGRNVPPSRMQRCFDSMMAL